MENEVIADFFSGFTAGFVAISACSPLEMMRTRFSLMVHYKSLVFFTIFPLRIQRKWGLIITEDCSLP